MPSGRPVRAKVAEITGTKAIRAGEPITDEDIAVACDMSLSVVEAVHGRLRGRWAGFRRSR